MLGVVVRSLFMITDFKRQSYLWVDVGEGECRRQRCDFRVQLWSLIAKKKILYNWAVKKRYRDDDTTETWQKSILTISMTIGNEPIGDILSDKN